jgi:hypothetical protein
LTRPQARHRKAPRRTARSCLLRSAQAITVSVGMADACANTLSLDKIRLTLTDEISSRVDSPVTKFEGRLIIDGLIQSHPHELYVQLEEKYQALPPFTQAKDAIAERYIVEATTSEKMFAGVTSIAGNLSNFVPTIRTSIRYDDLHEKDNQLDPDGNTIDFDYSTVLAVVNPTLIYETGRRKWTLNASYDYEKGQYFRDDDSTFTDHLVNVNWDRRLNRGRQLSVAMLYQNTHDRGTTEDSIVDFDSTLDRNLQSYLSKRVTLAYRKGTSRNRTRYNAYLFKENSTADHEGLQASNYDLDQTGVGGQYAWRIRRQMALVVEGRYLQSDFRLSNRDNTHFRSAIGADTSVGRRIQTSFRVGYAEKTFDKSINGDSFGELVWNGELQWDLRRNTSVQMGTGRKIYELTAFDEPSDVSKFNIDNFIRAEWAERWTDRLSTNTSYTYRGTSYEGREGNERGQQWIVSAIYQVHRKLRFAIDAAYTMIKKDDLSGDISRRTFTFRTDYSL